MYISTRQSVGLLLTTYVYPVAPLIYELFMYEFLILLFLV